MKRWITITGYLLILAAATLAFTRVFVTDAPNSVVTSRYDVSSLDSNFEYTYWNTRSQRVIVDVTPATSRINLYLLDEKGIDLLSVDHNNLQPVLNFTDIDGCDFTYQPPYRGVFLILIENRSNRTTHVSERIIGKGVEWDILQFSAALAILGTAMAIAPRFLRTGKEGKKALKR